MLPGIRGARINAAPLPSPSTLGVTTLIKLLIKRRYKQLNRGDRCLGNARYFVAEFIIAMLFSRRAVSHA